MTFRNNIIRAYADTTTHGAYNGGIGPAGLTYSGPRLGSVQQDHNVWFGPMRNLPAPAAAEVFADPMFVNEPPVFLDQTTLDHFAATLTPNSPGRGAGVAVTGLLVDLTGTTYATPPSMGALEYGSGYKMP